MTETIKNKIEELKNAKSQLEANINACIGAMQVLEQLLEEEEQKKIEQEEKLD